MEKYVLTIEAVQRVEHDTVSIGDALIKEITENPDKSKTFEEVSKAIEDALGIDYAPDYLRILRRTATLFPADVRAKYRKLGVSPTLLTNVATADVERRQEILDDILLAIDDLKYLDVGAVTELPEEIREKMTYPQVFTARTLELLWCKRKKTWRPTKSALLEAFGIKNDRTERVVTFESVLEAVNLDDGLKADLLEQLSGNNEVVEDSNDDEVVVNWEQSTPAPIEKAPKAEETGLRRAEKALSELTKAIAKAERAYESALEVFDDAVDLIDSDTKQSIIEHIEESQLLALALIDRVKEITTLDEELKTLTK